MRMGLSVRVLSFLVLGLVACAGPTPAGSRPAAPDSSAPVVSGPKPTLTLVVRYELTDLGAKTATSGASPTTKRIFNASMALVDSVSAIRPYLAESLPQLNTDSWKVLPDNSME